MRSDLFKSSVLGPMSLTILEGNIGAGKSTVGRGLEDLGFKVFFEPVEENPHLKDFYADKKQHAFAVQMWFLRNRFETYKQAVEYMREHGKDVVLDRSIFSDFVFALQNREEGNISETQFSEYKKIRDDMLRGLELPSLVVYLQVSAGACHERIKSRARDIEDCIPVDYLLGLERCYNTLLSNLGGDGIDVLRLDWETFGTAEFVAGKIQTKKNENGRLSSSSCE